MGVVRKNVRFHDDDPADMEIFHAVCDFRSYGFRSESHMIIEALRTYLSNNILSLSPEQLSEMIAQRVAGIANVAATHSTVTINRTDETKSIPVDNDKNDEAYNAALNFLDSL